MIRATGRSGLSASLSLLVKGAATGCVDIESSFEEKDKMDYKLNTGQQQPLEMMKASHALAVLEIR